MKGKSMNKQRVKSMNKQHVFTAYGLVVLIVAVLGIGGWIANIVKLVGMGFDPITGMAVARAVGIFVAPLGSVLGFL